MKRAKAANSVDPQLNDINMIKRWCGHRGYVETIKWLEDNASEYIRGIAEGFENAST